MKDIFNEFEKKYGAHYWIIVIWWRGLKTPMTKQCCLLSVSSDQMVSSFVVFEDSWNSRQVTKQTKASVAVEAKTQVWEERGDAAAIASHKCHKSHDGAQCCVTAFNDLNKWPNFPSSVSLTKHCKKAAFWQDLCHILCQPKSYI